MAGLQTQPCGRAADTDPVGAPTDAVEKQRVFDHYWETRDLRSADLRTRLRISIVESVMVHRYGRMLDVGPAEELDGVPDSVLRAWRVVVEATVVCQLHPGSG